MQDPSHKIDRCVAEQGQPVSFRYILEEDILYECLKKRKFIKTTGKRAIFEAVILGILSLLFFWSYAKTGETANLVFGVVSAVLLGIVLIVPEFALRRRAKREAGGTEFQVTLADGTLFFAGESGETMAVPLDGSCFYAAYHSCYVLISPGRPIIILPRDSIGGTLPPKLEEAITSGLVPED